MNMACGCGPSDWPVVSSAELLRSRLITVRADKVRMPDNHLAERTWCFIPAPWRARPGRRGPDPDDPAVPASGRPPALGDPGRPARRPGEPPWATAQRELAEEAGYRARDWRVLADYYSSPGYSTERLASSWPATWNPSRSRTRLRPPGRGGVPAAAWLPLDEAVRKVLAGELHNGAAALGIMAGYAARSKGMTELRQQMHPRSNDAPLSGRTAMKVGIPREIKNHEYRVAITPAGVHELVRGGHQVVIEAGAGEGSSIPDEDFTTAGAKILPTADDVWGEGDLILKVKEPIAEEYHRMRSGQVLFTYLHLAASKACTDALLTSGVTSIAYETVQLPDGSLPLLAPMSEVAGRMAPQVGAHHLQRDGGGRGVLMGGVSGVYAAKVVVLGAGVSGMNAAAIALGMQAEVLLVDKNVARLRQADAIYQGHCQTVASNAYEIERAVIDADLVIGAVLVPAPRPPSWSPTTWCPG
jgi:hypothetical protein